MLGKGLLKLQFHSFKNQVDKGITYKVNVKAADVQIQADMQNSEVNLSEHDHYLPCADKLIITVRGESKQIEGYFELPVKKIYELPMKTNIITVNCVTKNMIENSIQEKTFGILKISLVFLAGWSAKFDVIIDKVQLKQKELGAVERQLYVQCTVGNVSNKTTVKKPEETFWFMFEEFLPFKLESIPGDVQITIKDKDMVKDEMLGHMSVNPQKHFLFQQSTEFKQNKLDLSSSERNLKIFFRTKFKLLKNS